MIGARERPGKSASQIYAGSHGIRSDNAIASKSGAHVRARTGDLFLTKEVLCLLSYVGLPTAPGMRAPRCDVMVGREGIEPPQSKDG